MLVLSTGTNGRLAVWNVSNLEEGDKFEPLGSSVKIHQSGINCLDCRCIDSKSLFILTGGDDNALICTQLTIDYENKVVCVVDQQKNCNAHAAQISGKRTYLLLAYIFMNKKN